MLIRKQSFSVLTILIMIYAFAWILQDQLFLNWDVSWLMHAAKRLLNGGTYSHDFFETNPPLILYLYLPPILVNKTLNINLALAFRCYIFLLSALSLSLCYPFLRKIFSKQDPILRSVFIVFLAAAYLILPLHELGQRDHLLVMLTLPYLLAVVYRLQGNSIKTGEAALLGLLAGLGFALKPHFLITLVLIELYYAFSKKNLFACLRPETVMMLVLMSAYGAAIFAFFPDYLSFVVPYTMRVYYSSISSPWGFILLHPMLLSCALSLLCYALLYNVSAYKPLGMVLSLALIGFICSYVAQRTTFYYHLIPAFSFALLLSVLLYGSFISQPCKRKSDYLFAGLLGMLLFLFPIYLWYELYLIRVNHKERINHLITFMHSEAKHQPVYFFAPTTIYTFPSIDYAEVELGSRFPFLWMVAGLVNQPTFKGEKGAKQQQDKITLVNMIAEDLNQNKPKLVLVDIRDKKPYLLKPHFDYLAYFSDNPNFRQAWKNYQYLTRLKEPALYELAVYKRKPAT